MNARALTAVLLTCWLAGCATLSAERRAALELDAAPATVALQRGDFDQAVTLAQQSLTRNLTNSRASAVYALAVYQHALRDLATDAVTFASSMVASGLLRGNFWNRDFLDFAVKRADQRLAEVDRALAVAQDDQGFSLELCLACWEVDWNHSGEVDARDQRLLEIELDAQGQPLALDDPRRRPTFRFDWADVFWLRAMISFQRAGLALLAAYEPELKGLDLRRLKALRLKLRDAEQVHKARDLLLVGLAAARDCRKALDLETDDDREWVPNPRQKSHAMPLDVDQPLFDTWAQVVDDAGALVRGEKGLELKAVAQLSGRANPPSPYGFVDVGQLLSQPADVLVPLELTHDAEGLDVALSQLFGKALRRSMPPSPLPQRLERMRREVDRGEDTVERKLRYLFWLN